MNFVRFINLNIYKELIIWYDGSYFKTSNRFIISRKNLREKIFHSS